MKNNLAFIRIVCIAIFCVFMSGCSNIVYKQQLAWKPSDEKTHRTWLIFFDGTANDISKDTNVKKLHSLISLQSDPEVGTLYIEGVGVGLDIIGAGTGSGFARRVRLAYEFLLSNYHAGDRIYIFGFSRGAYQARVLASMLHYVGLPPKPLVGEQLDKSCDTAAVYKGTKWNVSPRNQDDFVKALFMEMKDGFFEGDVAHCVTTAQSDLQFESRRVSVLGLWDTVEALGKPDWTSRLLHKTGISPHQVNIDESNARYGDQLLNVDNVFHAVSIDDDREWIFTPLLVSRSHLLHRKTFPKSQLKLDATTPTSGNAAYASPLHTPKIQEVFFSGAHSDVGGGYGESDLSGVSLNWMIKRLIALDRQESKVDPKSPEKKGLLPSDTEVREDPYGSSHDPEAGWWAPLYHFMPRNLAAYAMGNTQTCANSKSSACESDQAKTSVEHEPMPQFKNTLCMHPTVFKRRKAMAVKDHENSLLRLIEPGNICVAADNSQLANPAVYKEVLGFPATEGADGKLRCDAASEEVRKPAVPIRITIWSEESGECGSKNK
jgi:uncharacterized protein (DUF2235 family)